MSVSPSSALPTRNPLSPMRRRLNGHVNYLDPHWSVSFPTALLPDPITLITGATKEFNLSKAVHGRASSICHYCGLRSAKYHEVVGPLSTFTSTQTHCACIFCAQVMALDLVSIQRSGVLLHLPELGQAQLNVYARIIYVCRISQGPVAESARAMLKMLMARRSKACATLGTDDPHILATSLAGCKTQQEHDGLIRRLRNIRLMPLDRRNIKEADLEFNQFPQILAYWRSKDGPFGGLTPPQMDLGEFRKMLEQLAKAT